MSDGIGPTLFMFQVEQKNLSYICADCPELVTVDPRGTASRNQCPAVFSWVGVWGVILITALALAWLFWFAQF